MSNSDYTKNSSESQITNSIATVGGDMRTAGAGDEHSRSAIQPPTCNNGGSNLLFHVDWFRITLHSPYKQVLELYNSCFSEILGPLSTQPFGRFAYSMVEQGLLNFSLLHGVDGPNQHCCLDFPGKACQAVPPEFFIDFLGIVVSLGINFKITRIDLAFDGCNFSPEQFYDAIQADKFRSHGTKKSLQYVNTPNQEREDGSGLGCSTTYFGSIESNRRVVVYNLHGAVRLEIRFKDDLAWVVGTHLLGSLPDDWGRVAMGHLRDFIDIQTDWWQEFTKGTERAYAKLWQAKEYEIAKLMAALITQTASRLSVVRDCMGQEYFDSFISHCVTSGRANRGHKYDPILKTFQPPSLAAAEGD